MKYPTKSNNEWRQLDIQIYQNIINNPVISIELLTTILGKQLGEGSSRIVFEYLPDPKYVIKIEKGNWHSNVLEWEVWNNVIGTRWEKWFAPIKSVSPNGTILLQRKCKPISDIPKQLPDFLDDVRIDNLGMLNGQVVVIDYAMNDLLAKALKKGKIINTKNHAGL